MKKKTISKEKISGNGATVQGKWPYFVLNFLDYYLQHKTTRGNVPETSTLTEISFTDPG
jgi:hypothetical protein